MNADAARGYREEGLRSALATDPRVGEPELTVAITGDAVIVRGVIPTEERRAQVAEVIRELASDLEFVDAMEVASAFPRPRGGETVT
ncbi:MAG TPA: BON domain-containing protein [Actinomycetota bacterium]|nr:BON domain-containing protein [Actinomycetota bacterium]